MTEPARPRAIYLAWRTTVASLALSTLQSTFDFLTWEWTDPLFDSLYVGFTLGSFALAAVICYLWYQRRRWARNIYLTFAAAMFPVQAWALWKLPPDSWDVWAGVVCFGILDLVVLALLTTRGARDWYARQPLSLGAR